MFYSVKHHIQNFQNSLEEIIIVWTIWWDTIICWVTKWILLKLNKFKSTHIIQASILWYTFSIQHAWIYYWKSEHLFVATSLETKIWTSLGWNKWSWWQRGITYKHLFLLILFNIRISVQFSFKTRIGLQNPLVLPIGQSKASKIHANHHKFQDFI